MILEIISSALFFLEEATLNILFKIVLRKNFLFYSLV